MESTSQAQGRLRSGLKRKEAGVSEQGKCKEQAGLDTVQPSTR